MNNIGTRPINALKKKKNPQRVFYNILIITLGS